MAEIVRMPKMSDTMTEGVVAKWHKKVGDTVKSGELMAEIETDKATMDYESFNTGTILYLGVEEGKAVAVNDVLAIVGNPGEDYKSLLEGAGSEQKPASQPAESKAAGNTQTETATATATAIDTSGIKAEIVLMPKMSDTMNEGVIAAWHKKVGDTVKTNELLAEIETDKATMEYESYNAGTLLYIGAEAGSMWISVRFCVYHPTKAMSPSATQNPPLTIATIYGQEVGRRAVCIVESASEKLSLIL